MTEGKKRVVSITLEPPQAEFLHHVEESYGTKAATFLRNLLQKRMEEEEDRQKPKIVYYALPTDRSGLPTTLPSSVPLPSVASFRNPSEVAGMMSANSEMKALLKVTKGNPRKALRKVSKSEIKAWKDRPTLNAEEKVIRKNSEEDTG